MTQYHSFEALESRLLLNAQVASWLQDSAQNVNVEPLASIDVPGSILDGKDVFSFTASATGKMVIDMLAAGSGLDSYLTIYSAKGKKIKANNNAYKGTLNSSITLNVKAGQTYYIVAEGKGGTGGDYTLHMTSRPKDDAGNTTLDAKKLKLTSSALSKSAAINYAGDVDVFSFTAKTTGSVTLSVVATGKNNPIDVKLTVLDAAGNVLVESGEPPVTFNVQAGTVYYVQVESTNDATGKYKLKRSKIMPVVSGPGDGRLPEEPTFDGAPEAGTTITAKVVSTDSGLQLMIYGTDGNDTIVLSQTPAALTLSTGTETYVFEGDFTWIVVYGFSGNDTFNFTSTVTAQGYIHGGNGNNSYFLAGSGTIWANGGTGNDLYVTVGGGIANINNEGGLNSYWVDRDEYSRISRGNSHILNGGPSAAEIAAGTVHVIDAFYQPWTSGADYIGLTPAGEKLRDPAITSSASKYVNFADKPLFAPGGPSYTDIKQGSVGDCYFLASLAALSTTHPMLLQQSITPLGDGTYAVRFYKDGKEVYLRLDGDLPTNSSGQLVYARAGGGGSIWVPLLEKAYAFFRTGSNSYTSIGSGWMSDVFPVLTGQGSTSRSVGGTAAMVYDFLETQLNAGKAVTAANTGVTAGPIVGGHAYTVMSVQMINGDMTVTVYNPWGYDGIAWDSNSSDGLLTLTVAQFQTYFTGGIVASKIAA